jgi:hypothetical protein
MDRDAKRLAKNVPASDLDRGDRRAMDVAAIERDAVEHGLGERADPAGIVADDEMFELSHGGFDGADEAVERALAEPGETGIRVQADEEPVLPAGPDGEGLDVGDLYRTDPGGAARPAAIRLAVSRP